MIYRAIENYSRLFWMSLYSQSTFFYHKEEEKIMVGQAGFLSSSFFPITISQYFLLFFLTMWEIKRKVLYQGRNLWNQSNDFLSSLPIKKREKR